MSDFNEVMFRLCVSQVASPMKDFHSNNGSHASLRPLPFDEEMVDWSLGFPRASHDTQAYGTELDNCIAGPQVAVSPNLYWGAANTSESPQTSSSIAWGQESTVNPSVGEYEKTSMFRNSHSADRAYQDSTGMAEGSPEAAKRKIQNRTA